MQNESRISVSQHSTPTGPRVLLWLGGFLTPAQFNSLLLVCKDLRVQLFSFFFFKQCPRCLFAIRYQTANTESLHPWISHHCFCSSALSSGFLSYFLFLLCLSVSLSLPLPTLSASLSLSFSPSLPPSPSLSLPPSLSLSLYQGRRGVKHISGGFHTRIQFLPLFRPDFWLQYVRNLLDAC